MLEQQDKRGVVLPFVLRDDQPRDGSGVDTPQDAPTPLVARDGAGATFLIIDDEPAIGRLIQRVAAGCGYIVTLTTSADQFMDSLAIKDPAVIVLDLAMPGLDGVEILRFLGASKCKAQILIVSGFDSRVLETTADLGAALGLRMAGTLEKPLRIGALRDAIEALVERRVS